MTNIMLIDQQKFIEEWANRFDSLATVANTTRTAVASMATALVQNLGALQANLEMNSDAVEQLDLYNQIWAKMLLSVLEKIIMIVDPTNTDRSSIKEKAKDDFQSLFQFNKEQVIEERTARLKELREKMDNERASKEQDTAEEALYKAEKSVSMNGGEGSTIPEGATVFGG